MSYISSATTVAFIDTGQRKTVFLPSTFNIEGKILTVKDKSGYALSSNITISAIGGDVIENFGSNYLIKNNYGAVSFVAHNGKWFSMNNPYFENPIYGLSSLASFVASNLYTYAAQAIIYADNTKSYIYQNNNNIQIPSLNALPVLYYAFGANNTWVAATFTNSGLYYSLNGNLWTQASFLNGPASIKFNFVTYQNNTWVALGKNSSNTAYLFYSTNGTTWQVNSNLNLPSVTSNIINGAGYGNGRWILFGQTSSPPAEYSYYYTSNISNGIFIYGTSFSRSNGVGVNGVYNASQNIWVSVGFEVIDGKYNTVKYSTNNGQTWSNSSNVQSNSTSGYDIFSYGNSVINVNNTWIVGGQQRDKVNCPIFQSSNGRSFTAIQTQDNSNIRQFNTITYDSTNRIFYAQAQYTDLTYRIVVSSNQCSNWTTISYYTPYSSTAKGLAIGSFNFTLATLDVNNTNIITSNIITSNIYANYFYGDGSGLSNLGVEVSSLSSIVSYGLSSVMGGDGISSLSSIISYGLSSIYDGVFNPINPGVSTLSSIISYGLSTVFAGGSNTLNPGVSSLSSIVSYGLSSIYTYATSLTVGVINPGVSTLSSIISYGLSTVFFGANNPINPGVSTLSTIVSYGLSSVNGGQGISSLSSIISYGLSSVNGGQGISSLSSIVSYGLSSISFNLSSNISSLTRTGLGTFNRYDTGGVGLSTLTNPPPDTITDAFLKVDNWLFNNLIGQSPFPTTCNFLPNTNSNTATVTFTPPFQIKSGVINRWMPYISTLNVEVINNSGNVNVFFQTGNRDFLPNGLSNTLGLFIDGRFGSEYSNATWLASYNGVNNIFYIPASNLSNSGTPYVIKVWYQNFSTEQLRIFSNVWTFSNTTGFPLAPTNLYFTTYNDSYGCTCDC